MPYRDELDYLTVKQGALITCVSEERFYRRIEKGLIPVVRQGDKMLVRSRDLIQHLIQYNIPIPDGLLQGNSRKILFILVHPIREEEVFADIIRALYKLRSKGNHILNFIEHDSSTPLKVMTFKPDIIFLFSSGGTNSPTESSIRNMAMKDIAVYRIQAKQLIDYAEILSVCSGENQ